MRDAKGLGYLARLLRDPHREFHVLDLLSGGAARGGDAPRPARMVSEPSSPDAGVMLDPPPSAPTASESPSWRPKSSRRADGTTPSGPHAAEAELDALTDELAHALGLGGRDRRAGSDSERARASVSKAVHSAMRRLDAAPRTRPPPVARRAHRHVLHTTTPIRG